MTLNTAVVNVGEKVRSARVRRGMSLGRLALASGLTKGFIIQVEHGRLRFRDPAFPEPILADEANIVVDLPVNPRPIAWSVTLGRTTADGEPGRLVLQGSSHRSARGAGASGRGDATISLQAARWPWASSRVATRSQHHPPCSHRGVC